MEENMSAFYSKPNRIRGCGGAGIKCGRWNPTVEQVKVLTDLFRSGLRTPSTDQIQKISTQLSFYGKIESKNVFYWFQNHKARERQKRRKVSIDHEKDFVRREDRVSSESKDMFEIHHGPEQERVIETLQLFPITSFEESKIRFRANESSRGTSALSYSCGNEIDHPPLDLRLSFM